MQGSGETTSQSESGRETEAPMSRLPWSEVIRAWWAFQWRAQLSAFLLGTTLGGLGGVVARLSGNSGHELLFGAAFGLAVYVPCSIWAMRAALDLFWRRREALMLSDRFS